MCRESIFEVASEDTSSTLILIFFRPIIPFLIGHNFGTVEAFFLKTWQKSVSITIYSSMKEHLNPLH